MIPMERQSELILEENEEILDFSSMSKDSHGEEMLTGIEDNITETDCTTETAEMTEKDNTTETDVTAETDNTTEIDGTTERNNSSENDAMDKTGDNGETDANGETDDRNIAFGGRNKDRKICRRKRHWTKD